MAFARWLQSAPWIVEVTENAVQISIVWLFHFLGYFLLVGSTVVVDLRVIGLAKQSLSASKLAKQLFPWIWVGWVLVALSGFIMFAGDATVFYPGTVFRIKVLVFLAATVAGYLVQRNVRKWDQLPSIPTGAKALALISLLLWIGMILASVEVPAFLPV
jgi:hypothetical protein